MKHPNPKIQERQDEFLKNANPEEREFHEKLFRIGNAYYVYHQNAGEKEIPIEYFNEWLSGLPEPIKSDMKNRGFDECKTILPFTRYVNERRDVGMDDWMKEHLSESDFEFYRVTHK